MSPATKDPSFAASHEAPLSGDKAFTRLHITPFDADLLKAVLPASVLPSARNISFHTLENFPDKPYGFVDLPNMDADKIKRKLNGATLRGAKMRVEKARPDTREEPDDASPKPKKRKKKTSEPGAGPEADGESSKKRRKRDYDVLEGVALKDRKVKRGWTETTDDAKKKKSRRSKEEKALDKAKVKDKNVARKRLTSKHTEGEECLLNMKLPPNAVQNLTNGEGSAKRRKKDKNRQVTVHEFEKTTKFPSFLKDASAAASGEMAIEYEDGKGWVDADGNIVETARETKKLTVRTPKPKKQKKRAPTPEQPEKPEEADDTTSSSGSSSEDESLSSSSDEEPSQLPAAANQTTPESSSKTDKTDKTRPMSSSSSRSLTIKIPPPITPSGDKVHPLEALYKRAKPDGAATETPAQAGSFSFFGGGADDENEDESSEPVPTMPMTPYSRQDFEWRATRSAAPTPDTAHPSRVRNFWAHDVEPAAGDDAPLEEDIEDEEDDEKVANTGAKGDQQEKSDFQNWFWENRRDLNRSWMKRRKASAKEKRHRDNKARASRVF